jgi:hypothetical protein
VLSSDHYNTLEQSICKFLNTYRMHCNSHEVAAKARYSASEDDLQTVNCFFVIQDIRELPRKNLLPVTDLLESLYPAQSAT